MKNDQGLCRGMGFGLEKFACYSGLIFLLVSCLTRFGVLVSCNPNKVQLVGVLGGMLFLSPLFKPSWLKPILFLFALSFPLYGSLPYSSQSFLFEFYLNIIALVLLVQSYREGTLLQRKLWVLFPLITYLLLASASLLLLPARDILWKLFLWDWVVFWNAVFFATPELSLYSVAAVARLALFILFVTLLAGCRDGRALYQIFFIGLLVGAFWASVVGIFEYYRFFDLTWLREAAGGGARLRSVFANPGWFAEFLAVTIPYVLLGFISQKLKVVQKFCLFAILVVCEIAIILTYSRTGWLIYPLVLLVCWFFFYIATQVGNGIFSWSQIARLLLKVLISVPLTLLISYVLVFYVFNAADSSKVHEGENFGRRVSEMASPVTRKVIWAGSLEIVKEKPFFGLGYESFKFQDSILKKLKNLRLKYDTPHSFYLQLLVSGGIAGLVLWGILLFATLYLLISELIKNKAYFNIAVVLSIVAFHLYGFAQAMQYISVIWFLVFLNIGYAMTINENVLPEWMHKRGPLFAMLLSLFVIGGGIAYTLDFESKKLAEKEYLQIYSLDQEQESNRGFYSPEYWGKLGVYRWMGSSAIMKLPLAELFEFTFVCGAPDLAGNPLVLTVHNGDRALDSIVFHRQESITRQYSLTGASLASKKLFFSVSRTWNLKRLGIANDSRNLGVAISKPKILKVGNL